jgi:hypothetical protein
VRSYCRTRSDPGERRADGFAATTWAQSTAVRISEVTNIDSPPATAENSRSVYQLDRSEEDCREAMYNCGQLFNVVKNRFWFAHRWIVPVCHGWAAEADAKPTPFEAPQPGVRPPLSPLPRYEDWSFAHEKFLNAK